MKVALIAVATTICCFFPSSVRACSCEQRSLKKLYCESKWVSHIRIQSEIDASKLLQDDTTGLRIYDVNVIEAFKANPAGESHVLLFTPKFSSLCGLKLLPDNDYILSGSFVNDRLHATTCGDIKAQSDDDMEKILNKLRTLAKSNPCE